MNDAFDELSALAERGDERGAGEVLAGARLSARRYGRRRQVLVAGLGSLVVLSAAVGVGLSVHDGDGPDTVAQAPPDGSTDTGETPMIRSVRLEGHRGFDRLVIEYDTDDIDAVISNTEIGLDPPEGETNADGSITLPPVYDNPACTPHLPDGTTTIAYSSASSSRPDGLPPGLANGPITGDTTYVTEVVPLCGDNGWVVFVVNHNGLINDVDPVDAGGSDVAMVDCDLENPARIQTDIFDIADGARLTSPSGCPEPLLEDPNIPS